MAWLAIALPVGGGTPQKLNGSPLVARQSATVSRSSRRCGNGSAFPPLGIGVQAIRLSPYHAGLAGRHLKRLPATSAFLACSFPLRLSPSGKPDGPEIFLQVSPDCIRDSAPRSAAHAFTASGSPVDRSFLVSALGIPPTFTATPGVRLAPFALWTAFPSADYY